MAGTQIQLSPRTPEEKCTAKDNCYRSNGIFASVHQCECHDIQKEVQETAENVQTQFEASEQQLHHHKATATVTD